MDGVECWMDDTTKAPSSAKCGIDNADCLKAMNDVGYQGYINFEYEGNGI